MVTIANPLAAAISANNKSYLVHNWKKLFVNYEFLPNQYESVFKKTLPRPTVAPYVTWGLAPTKAPPMKWTTPRAAPPPSAAWRKNPPSNAFHSRNNGSDGSGEGKVATPEAAARAQSAAPTRGRVRVRIRV